MQTSNNARGEEYFLLRKKALCMFDLLGETNGHNYIPHTLYFRSLQVQSDQTCSQPVSTGVR
jgi:hypothetical protein